MLARTIVILALAVLPLPGWAAEPIDFGAYRALIIGINEYAHLPKLETAVNDAVAVDQVLRDQYGFETTLVINPGRYDLVRALDKLRAELTERDNLLIFYAGHGYLDRQTGEGFWLPADAEEDSQANWVPVHTVTSTLRAMIAKHVLVIADSCYSGTLLREAPAMLSTGAERHTELRRIASARGRKALTSGGLEPVVDNGGDGHSVFTRALLNTLSGNREILEGYQLYTGLRRSVVLNAEQTPQYSDIRFAGDEGGDFLFVPLSVVAAEMAAISPAAGSPGLGSARPAGNKESFELTFWRSIEGSSDPAAFEEFLRQFPNSPFSGLARLNIKRLGGTDPSSSAEQKVALLNEPGTAIEILEMEAEYSVLENANIREGPAARTAKVGLLKRGATVAVTGKVKDANWYRIQRGDGSLGYVYGSLLRERNTGADTALAGAGRTEITFWNSIKDSNNQAGFELYLKRYPDGVFAELAMVKLEEISLQATKKYATILGPSSALPTGSRPTTAVFRKTSKPVKGFKDCALCPEMVEIPAGSFMMILPSAKTGRYDGGSTQRRVSVRRPFALSRYEVTFAEWDACATEGDCSYRPADEGWGRGKQPVINVSWEDAQEYARWLSRKTGAQYRLPSEGEWEFAARSGTTTVRYWGDDPSAACWYANVHDRTSQAENSFAWQHHNCSDGYAKTAPVGSFEANAFGLHDMLGNIWEWVEDCWGGDYQAAPSDGQARVSGRCDSRVLRGGSWSSVPKIVRSGARQGDVANYRGRYSGFRVARSLN